MRRILVAAFLSMMVALAGPPSATPARAEGVVGASFGLFHETLSPHGRWFGHPRYGRVWSPAKVPAGWRPYTYGRWAWTEEHGWTWVSYYDWGWAPFHYGRWVYGPGYGWYWVPNYVWAPAWVAWRTGNGFIGWYPLPPEAYWSPGAGVIYGGSFIYGDFYTPYWVFVPERHFLSFRIYDVVVVPRHNRRFVRFTHRRTRYRWVNNRIVNRSIRRAQIRRATGRRVVPTPIRVVRRRGNWRRPQPGTRRVRIYRPPYVRRGPAPRTPRARIPRIAPRGPGAPRPRYLPPGQTRPRYAPPGRARRAAPRAAPRRRAAPRPGAQPRRHRRAPPNGNGRRRRRNR